MESKKFLIFRIIIIILTVSSLCFIEVYQKKIINNEKRIIEEKKNEMTEEVVLDAAKLYITNHSEYYNDFIKDSIDIKINTDDLVKEKLINNNEDFKGYVDVSNDEFSFVKVTDMLINSINSKDYEANSNNEKDAYDIAYYYKGDNPNNYIKYNEKVYRIIGINNNKDLKLISTESTVINKWGLSGDINYLKTDEKITDEGYKGIFYVGYVRSETNDKSSIIKNEKRNNTYTISTPKYIGSYSYVSLSDIVNSSVDCKFNKITDINKDTCNSYLLDMLINTFTSTSLENNMVYKINEKFEITSSKLEENINVKKVIYLSGYSEYKSGNGTKENPYEIK